MTTSQVGNVDEFDPVDAAGEPDVVPAVAGRSPTQLAFERFRQGQDVGDRVLHRAVYVMAAIVCAASSATSASWTRSPFHQDRLDPETGSLPLGRFGGISWSHPLGLEPGTGRDLMSRIWLGISFSMLVALSASMITVFIGVVLGIIAGFSRGWVDAIIGRFIDLTLTFPQLLLILALSSVGLAFVEEKLHVPSGHTVTRGLHHLAARILRLDRPGASGPRSGAVAARARVHRCCARVRCRSVPDVLQGDPAQPLGADHRDLHALLAGLRVRGGGAVLPGRQHQGADADTRQHPHRLAVLREPRLRRTSSSRPSRSPSSS